MTTTGKNKGIDSYRLFLDRAEQTTGLTRGAIKDHLKARFDKFNVKYSSKYMEYLMKIAEKEEEEDLTSKITQKAVPCPICGATTYGDLAWYGKRTKTQGWRCNLGGLTCFVEHKGNVIVAKQNILRKPEDMYRLPFVSLWMDWWMSIYKEDCVDEGARNDPQGTGESGCSRPTEDIGTDSGVGGLPKGKSGGVPSGTPARLGDL